MRETKEIFFFFCFPFNLIYSQKYNFTIMGEIVKSFFHLAQKLFVLFLFFFQPMKRRQTMQIMKESHCVTDSNNKKKV